ncbi:hypothetical protein pb186bvf_000002 [Paramecium bursaria]
MQAISEALQLPLNFFEDRFTKDPTILFIIFNYPKHTWSGDEWGVREHTDSGFLTILKQDNSGGLQVKTRDHRWIEAPPVENSFVINIGDMLELWTHGLYRATPHRVRNQAPNDRLSLPFFFDPNWESTLEPIPKEQLPQISQALIQIDSAINRWDGLQLEKLSKNTTYGQHLSTKLSKICLEILIYQIIFTNCVIQKDLTQIFGLFEILASVIFCLYIKSGLIEMLYWVDFQIIKIFYFIILFGKMTVEKQLDITVPLDDKLKINYSKMIKMQLSHYSDLIMLLLVAILQTLKDYLLIYFDSINRIYNLQQQYNKFNIFIINIFINLLQRIMQLYLKFNMKSFNIKIELSYCDSFCIDSKF